jgi:hypothetical protein
MSAFVENPSAYDATARAETPHFSALTFKQIKSPNTFKGGETHALNLS